MTRVVGKCGAWRQSGMALISALLLLLVVTIMAISMFRSYGMQEKIAGNVREKERALNAAVSAQQSAEQYLLSGTAPPSAQCSGLVSATVGQVCSNDLLTVVGGNVANIGNVPWTVAGVPVGVTYTPFTSVSINGVLNTVSAAPSGQGATLSYYNTPVFYISDLGPQAGGNGEYYQIDAYGYGSTPNAVAVVESTYLVSTNVPRNPNL